jgi:hypothetical protein
MARAILFWRHWDGLCAGEADKGLPSLTALVVAEEATHRAQDGSSSVRQHVFAFDWHSVSPPTLDELAA